jgi:hypothetical protein
VGNITKKVNFGNFREEKTALIELLRKNEQAYSFSTLASYPGAILPETVD